MPACIKVDRRYLNLITHRQVKVECDFLEGLNYDVYIVQAGKLNHTVKSDLERLLSILGQTDFTDKTGYNITLPEKYAGQSHLVKRLLRRLTKLREEDKVRESMDFDDLIYEELEWPLGADVSSYAETSANSR